MKNKSFSALPYSNNKLKVLLKSEFKMFYFFWVLFCPNIFQYKYLNQNFLYLFENNSCLLVLNIRKQIVNQFLNEIHFLISTKKY